MHIERFTPQIRKTLVKARERVVLIKNDANPNRDRQDRRKTRDRRNKNLPINFKDRREGKDRRKQDQKAAIQDHESNLGQNIDISV